MTTTINQSFFELKRNIFALAALMVLVMFSQASGATLRDLADQNGIYIGACVDPTPLRNETDYGDTLKREFNMVVAENAMKMRSICPSEGVYDWADSDYIVNFATQNNMAIRGHTLCWYQSVPTWCEGKTGPEIRTILQNHVTAMCTRWKGKIYAWDVLNEAVSDSGGTLRSTIWDTAGSDYIDQLFIWANQADPDAKLFYNDYGIEFPYASVKTEAAYDLVSGLLQRGVPIHGIGFQCHIDEWDSPVTGSYSFDSIIKRFIALGLEVHITELDVSLVLPATQTNYQQQADQYGAIMQMTLNNKPDCNAFMMWGFTDKYSWIPYFNPGEGEALIFDASYNPKPAYTRLNDVLAAGPNYEPAIPGIPAGETSITAGISCSYSASAVDPDGDRVKYVFDWGDATTFGETALVLSGSSGSASHTWQGAGEYYIKVKAVDEHSNPSEWSDALVITVAEAALPENLDNAKTWPNPFIPEPGNMMKFTDLSAQTEVKVYTLSGKLVRSLSESGGEATWNGENSDGQSISPGLYIYVMTDNQGNKKTGKIVISK
jgi:endo-1,4-beta-xylanase